MGIIVRNVLAVLAGIVIGSVVNMGLVMAGPALIPAPAGADVTTLEGLRASIHLFEPKHFLFPFLAHALGTLAGAFVAARFGTGHPRRLAMVIGLLFLAGGIANVLMLPAPLWLTVLDLIGAYIPMAYVGAWIETQRRAPGTP
jgi:hypothetical protein